MDDFVESTLRRGLEFTLELNDLRDVVEVVDVDRLEEILLFDESRFKASIRCVGVFMPSKI